MDILVYVLPIVEYLRTYVRTSHAIHKYTYVVKMQQVHTYVCNRQ